MAARYIGLMSGTSMDGIDAVLADLSVLPPRLLACRSHAWPEELRRRLRTAVTERIDLDEFGRLDQAAGAVFAQAALAVLDTAGLAAGEVTAIGSHGQTILHRPAGPEPFSLQIGDPNLIAEHTGITTVADFRRRDIAAGGQGAPLVPPFHAACFRSPDEDRAVLNIGGIANLTLLPADESAPVTGFDTGPGNCLLDGWVRRHTGQPHDRDGAWAAGGKVSGALLEALLDEPWLKQPPPRSTGPELFNLAWLEARIAIADAHAAPQDVQSTLAEFTAQTISAAVQTSLPGVQRLLVCGGGVHNRDLMDRLGRSLPDVTVEPTDSHGLPADWVEAAAFAWLAKQTLEGRPGNLPSVTGARRAVVLGAIYRA